jgi:hypothetical protein
MMLATWIWAFGAFTGPVACVAAGVSFMLGGGWCAR